MSRTLFSIVLLLAMTWQVITGRQACGQGVPRFADILSKWKALEKTPQFGERNAVGEGTGSKHVAAFKRRVVTKVGESGFVVAGTSDGVESVMGVNEDYKCFPPTSSSSEAGAKRRWCLRTT